MFKKKIDVISAKVDNLSGLVSTKSYFGKKVVSKSGITLGKVTDVVLKNTVLQGVLLNGKYKLFVDKDYFSSDLGEAIMLSIDPVIMMKGKLVFDAQGRKLGKVIDLDKNSNANTFNALIVKKSIFKKAFLIPKEEIVASKGNIILNKMYGG